MSVTESAVRPAPPPVALPPPDQELLSLRMTRRGTSVVVVAQGEVDLSNAHTIADLFSCVVRGETSRAVLDLAGITFFSLAGLDALLRARAMVVAAGGDLLLRAPSAITERVLTLTGTLGLFPVTPHGAIAEDVRPAAGAQGWPAAPALGG